MKIYYILLTYLGRKAVVPTLVGTACLAGYELFPSAPLSGRNLLSATIVLVHTIWVSWALARLHKGEMAFLYTRGFRWDVIWWHRVLVGAISALLAVAAAWLFLCLNLRSTMQVAMGNSLYPLVARRETWVPFSWLELYALFLPVSFYAFVRVDRQSPRAGLWLGIAVVFTTIFTVGFPPAGVDWFSPARQTAAACLIVMLLWAGQKLHRNVEVAS